MKKELRRDKGHGDVFEKPPHFLRLHLHCRHITEQYSGTTITFSGSLEENKNFMPWRAWSNDL